MGDRKAQAEALRVQNTRLRAARDAAIARLEEERADHLRAERDLEDARDAAIARAEEAEKERDVWRGRSLIDEKSFRQAEAQLAEAEKVLERLAALPATHEAGQLGRDYFEGKEPE